MSKKDLSIVELFSGPGGLGLGFHLEGFKTIVAYEYEDDCIDTYRANFPEVEVIKKDLTNFNDEDIESLKQKLFSKIGTDQVDIVMGGPPCRSFSTANPKKQTGDQRDFLYRTLIKVAGALNANYFIMENVTDLNAKATEEEYDKKIFHYILEDLQDAGFKYINCDVLNSADFGAPQTRERLIIFGTKKKYLPLTFPEPVFFKDQEPKWITVADALQDLPDISAPKDIVHGKNQNLLVKEKRLNVCKQYSDKPRNNFTKYCRNLENDYGYNSLDWMNEAVQDNLELFIIPNHEPRIIERYSLLLEDENQGVLVKRLTRELQTEELEDLYTRKVLPKKVFTQKNRKLPFHKPSRTVTSHAREELVHPHHNRNLTAREVARLQSFPDWYKFKGVNQKPYKATSEDIGNGRDYYHQIGDAVPPLLSAALAKEIKKNLTVRYNEANESDLREELIKWIIDGRVSIMEIKRPNLFWEIPINKVLSGISNIENVALPI